MAKNWNDMSTEEKLEKLHADNQILAQRITDAVLSLSLRVESLEKAVQKDG